MGTPFVARPARKLVTYAWSDEKPLSAGVSVDTPRLGSGDSACGIVPLPASDRRAEVRVSRAAVERDFRPGPEGGRGQCLSRILCAVMLELELAISFLHRRSRLLLRGTALAAFAGVALATTALVITVSLMTGYSYAIAKALQRGNAHLIGFAPADMKLDQATRLAERLAGIKGVRAARPVTYLMGLIEDARQPASPLPIVVKAVARPPEFIALDRWPEAEDRMLPAVLGRQLAAQLGLQAGDRATILLPPKAGSMQIPSLGVSVIGTFSLEFAEFDQQWLVVPLGDLLAALPGSGVKGVELVLDDPLKVAAVRQPAEEAAPLMFTDWREMNQSLFTALRWQTVSLSVVLALVVAVASFQVSSSLVVLAINKRRTSGMLQALGATPARVRRVLVLAGTMLGCSGVAAGIVAGCTTSALLSRFRVIRFPEGLATVYMVDHIPLIVEPVQLGLIVLVCGLLVAGASVWPAWRASRLDPVAALKAV